MTLGANTLATLVGCALLGALAAAVGCFVIARRRALVADVAGHATLAGACVGFLAAHAFDAGAAAPWAIPIAAAIAAWAASWCADRLARFPRIGPDAAAAVVLAGFFGLGAVLLTVVQSHESGAQGGLRRILLGNAAAMTTRDLALISAIALASAAVLVALFKELSAVAFDETHARLAGIPARALDRTLVALMVATMAAGMQVVGVVLVVALLLAPAAAARQFGGTSARATATAALIGAGASAAGVLASLASPQLPTGSVVTLAACLAFGVAVLARGRRGSGAGA
jgi:manganese/zinc/iron transport system permease protein